MGEGGATDTRITDSSSEIVHGDPAKDNQHGVDAALVVDRCWLFTFVEGDFDCRDPGRWLTSYKFCDALEVFQRGADLKSGDMGAASLEELSDGVDCCCLNVASTS